MAISTSYSTINSLGDFSFISGATYTLKFTVLNQSGSEVDLSSATCTWKLSPYGTGSAILNKTGSVIATNIFSISITESDTYGLAGKFTHQPIITFSNGNIIKPAQGTITLTKGLV